MKNYFIKGIALALATLLAIPSFSLATISLVQTKAQGDGYVNTYTVTPSSNITASSTLALCITAGEANTVLSIADTKLNTWTLATSSRNTTSGERQSWLYYVKNAISGATTITVTWGAAQFADSGTIFREYSGASTTAPLDKVSAAMDGTNYNTTHEAGTTSATTYTNELVVLCGGYSNTDTGTSTAGSGYGNGLEQKGSDRYTFDFMADKTVTATSTQTGNFTTVSSSRGQALLATFVDATQPSATVNKNMLMSFGF